MKTLKLAHITDHLTRWGWSERRDAAAEVPETCWLLWCLDTQGAWRGKGIWSRLCESEGGESESPSWKWAPPAEGNCRMNRNQKDTANPVVTGQELITRGNYCLAHFLWHRILKHQQTCLECSGTQARPNLLLQSIHDIQIGKVGIDKDWEPPVLILQSTWSCSQHGMPGWGDDLCELL